MAFVAVATSRRHCDSKSLLSLALDKSVFVASCGRDENDSQQLPKRAQNNVMSAYLTYTTTNAFVASFDCTVGIQPELNIYHHNLTMTGA